MSQISFDLQNKLLTLSPDSLSASHWGKSDKDKNNMLR